MATEIKSDNYSTVNFAHTALLAAKEFFVSAGRVFMSLNGAAANAADAHVWKSDRIKGPKATGETWAVGEKLYFDPAAKKFTKAAAAGANTLCAMAVEAALTGDTEGEFALFPYTIA